MAVGQQTIDFTMDRPKLGPNQEELNEIFFGFEKILMDLGMPLDEIGYVWAEYAKKYLPKLLQDARNELSMAFVRYGIGEE